jgi:hypothetical protein
MITILNSFLMVAVLFSILFQYIHSYEHFEIQISEKKCHHKYFSNDEITHQHHKYDLCFICDFKISNFIHSDVTTFDLKKPTLFSRLLVFKSREITQFFKGSLFALRAPPSFIV